MQRVVVQARVAVALPQLLLPSPKELLPVRPSLDVINILIYHLDEVLLHRELLMDLLRLLCCVHCSHLARLLQLRVEEFNVFALALLGHDLAHEPLALLVLLHLLVIEHLEQVLLPVHLAWEHAPLQLLRELFLVFVQHFN